MPHELDGKYQVTSTTSYQGPLEKKSDGLTEIKDGKTMRRDTANCLWTSSFNIISDKEVEMISIADPSEANSDFSLTAPDGSPTRKPVTYKAILRLARKQTEKGELIQLSGQIDFDDNVTLLTMRKIL